MNFIHDEVKKTQSPIKNFVSFKLLKFEQRDEMSQIFQSWSGTSLVKIEKFDFDIEKLWDQRLRFMFK